MDLFLSASTLTSCSVLYSLSLWGELVLLACRSSGILASLLYMVAFLDGATEPVEPKKGCLDVDLFWDRLLLLLTGDRGESFSFRFLAVRLVSWNIFLNCLFIKSCSSTTTAFFGSCTTHLFCIYLSADNYFIILAIALFSPMLFLFLFFSFSSSCCFRPILSIASSTQGSGYVCVS